MTLVSLKRRALYHTPIPRRNTFFETLFFKPVPPLRVPVRRRQPFGWQGVRSLGRCGGKARRARRIFEVPHRQMDELRLSGFDPAYARRFAPMYSLVAIRDMFMPPMIPRVPSI